MGTTNYYRPLVVILYNLTWQSLGGRPLAFHLLNVVGAHAERHAAVPPRAPAHRRDRTQPPPASRCSFAVHPLNVEVVAWASCLPELAFTAFGLSALLLHIAAWSRSGASARKLRVGGIRVCSDSPCSCKETALAFVPLIVLLELWLRPATRARPMRSSPRPRIVPYLGAAAVFFAARTAVLGGLIPPGGHGSRTVVDALRNAPWLLLALHRSRCSSLRRSWSGTSSGS